MIPIEWKLCGDTWMLHWGNIVVGQVTKTHHGIYASFLTRDLRFAMAHRDPVTIEEGKAAVETALDATPAISTARSETKP